MSALVASRTTNATIGLLAERIDVAQQQEITLMQRWLAAHDAVVPAVDGRSAATAPATPSAAAGATHDHAAMADHAMLMPGMLTAAQLEQLSAARGAAFDRLFLTLMIQHHEGALAMVATLFSTTGSGQDPALFEFASDVDGGQRAEIARMRALLKAPARGARR